MTRVDKSVADVIMSTMKCLIKLVSYMKCLQTCTKIYTINETLQ